MSHERKKPGWMFWVTVFLLALVFYVASIGPVVRIMARPAYIGIDLNIPFIYVPVIWLAQQSDVTASFLDWYLMQWLSL